MADLASAKSPGLNCNCCRGRSERTQEVEDVLLVLGGQLAKVLDHSIGLASRAVVLFDSLHQIGRASIVEEEDALPDTPERGSSKLIRARATLRDAIGKTFSHVVNEEVGPEVRGLVGQGSARGRGRAAGNHFAGGKRRRVAMGATNFCEGVTSVDDRRRVGRGSGRSKHAHEVGKAFDVGDDGRIGGSRGCDRKVERVIWRSDEKTGGSLVAFLREQLVRDTHFDIVGFAGEHDQGLVLRLPAETSDGAVVGAAIDVAAEDGVGVAEDTQRGLLGGVGLHVGQDGGVRDGLDQSCTENRSRDSEDDVWIPTLASERISRRQEVKLSDVATGRVGSAGDDEEIVDSAVRGTIAFFEPRLTDRTIRRDEPRHGVLRAIQVGNIGQGILRRARPAHIGLRVTG